MTAGPSTPGPGATRYGGTVGTVAHSPAANMRTRTRDSGRAPGADGLAGPAARGAQGRRGVRRGETAARCSRRRAAHAGGGGVALAPAVAASTETASTTTGLSGMTKEKRVR